MPSIDLPGPPRPDLHLPVPRAVAVADDKMVGQSILHVPGVPVIIIVSPGVARSSAAVVDDNVLPASTANGCPVDGSTNVFGKISPAAAKPAARRRCKLSQLLIARLLDRNRCLFDDLCPWRLCANLPRLFLRDAVPIRFRGRGTGGSWRGPPAWRRGFFRFPCRRRRRVSPWGFGGFTCSALPRGGDRLGRWRRCRLCRERLHLFASLEKDLAFSPGFVGDLAACDAAR